MIHHSNRGIQFCRQEYLDTLASFQIQGSMTDNSDPLENAIAERVNGILKQQCLSPQPACPLREAEQHLHGRWREDGEKLEKLLQTLHSSERRMS